MDPVTLLFISLGAISLVILISYLITDQEAKENNLRMQQAAQRAASELAEMTEKLNEVLRQTRIDDEKRQKAEELKRETEERAGQYNQVVNILVNLLDFIGQSLLAKAVQVIGLILKSPILFLFGKRPEDFPKKVQKDVEDYRKRVNDL